MIQVPGYLIKREIGKGGMATVYLAVQVSLDREVALKVMQPTLANDPNFSRRFLQEARTLASLSHPHIVAVYDVGATESQLHYFSMQHLRGGDFAHRIQAGVQEAEVLRVLRAMARALGFAHQRGFVHRDVSPPNILFDASDNPILTDFGIARAVSRAAHVTSSGVSVGTSYYMSPEQARGGDVDARSDIYSLGCVAYEALTGKPPFEGEDGFAIAYAHVFEPVPHLPDKLAHWQPLIDRALAKDPRERFGELDSFLAVLDGVAPKVARPVENLEPEATAVAPALVATPVAPMPEQQAAKRVPALKPSAGAPTSRAAPGNRRLMVVLAATVLGVGALTVLGLNAFDALRKPALVAPGASTPATTTIPASAPPRQAKVPPPTSASVASDPTSELRTVAEGQAAFEPDIGVADPFGDTSPVAGAEDVPGAEDSAEASVENAKALRIAVATTAVDPINLLLALAKADLVAQRYANPPGRNALERYRLVLKLAERFRATRDIERAKLGIVATATGYVDLAEKRYGEGKETEFLDYLERGVAVAQTLPEGGPVVARVSQRRAGLRDAALDAGRKAVAVWDKATAVTSFERALFFDAGSTEARTWLGTARRIGEIGFVFRDPVDGGTRGPELVVASLGGRKLAVARRETTLGEFRRYWKARGARVRGADRPSCRDRESFFRSSRTRNFENPGIKQDSNHAVVCVAWDDAVDFVRWLSEQTGKRYRLLSSPEWTQVARGAASVRACGANLGDGTYAAQFKERNAFACDDGYAATASVGSFDASPPGTYDMAGNVREWVSDCAPGCREHIAIGSAWISTQDKADIAQRVKFGSDVAANTVGFRVAREL